jgi:hypothetical protein
MVPTPRARNHSMVCRSVCTQPRTETGGTTRYITWLPMMTRLLRNIRQPLKAPHQYTEGCAARYVGLRKNLGSGWCL